MDNAERLIAGLALWVTRKNMLNACLWQRNGYERAVRLHTMQAGWRVLFHKINGTETRARRLVDDTSPCAAP